MFEVVAYTVVIVAVLAFSASQREASEFLEGIEILEEGCAEMIEAAPEMPEMPEILEIPAVVEMPEILEVIDYTTLTIEALKAEGKRLKVRGWQAWKKPETAIARLTAAAA